MSVIDLTADRASCASVGLHGRAEYVMFELLDDLSVSNERLKG